MSKLDLATEQLEKFVKQETANQLPADGVLNQIKFQAKPIGQLDLTGSDTASTQLSGLARTAMKTASATGTADSAYSKEYRGIVLREDVISGASAYELKAFGAMRTQPPKVIPKVYTVYIPELDGGKTQPTKLFSSNLDNPNHPSQRIIDYYTKFVAESEDTPPASPGMIVRVAFDGGDPDQGIYKGPEDNASQGGAYDINSGTSPKDTFQAAFANLNSLSANPPAGQKLGALGRLSNDISNLRAENARENTDENQDGIIDKCAEKARQPRVPDFKRTAVTFDKAIFGPTPQRLEHELRDDVAQDLLEAKDVINRLGGRLLCSETSRDINTLRPTSQADFHTLYASFDLFIRNSTLNPDLFKVTLRDRFEQADEFNEVLSESLDSEGDIVLEDLDNPNISLDQFDKLFQAAIQARQAGTSATDDAVSQGLQDTFGLIDRLEYEGLREGDTAKVKLAELLSQTNTNLIIGPDGKIQTKDAEEVLNQGGRAFRINKKNELVELTTTSVEPSQEYEYIVTIDESASGLPPIGWHTGPPNYKNKSFYFKIYAVVDPARVASAPEVQVKDVYGNTYMAERKELRALFCPPGKTSPQIIKVNRVVIPLTDILLAHGFHRIKSTRSWWEKCSNASYELSVREQGNASILYGYPTPLANWWHFQSHNGLIDGQTRWGPLAKLMWKNQQVNKLADMKNYVFRGTNFIPE